MKFFFSFYKIFHEIFFQFWVQIFEKLTPSEVPITKIYECINFLIRGITFPSRATFWRFQWLWSIILSLNDFEYRILFCVENIFLEMIVNGKIMMTSWEKTLFVFIKKNLNSERGAFTRINHPGKHVRTVKINRKFKLRKY